MLNKTDDDEKETYELQVVYNTLLQTIVSCNNCIKTSNIDGYVYFNNHAKYLIDCYKDKISSSNITIKLKVDEFLHLFKDCHPYMLCEYSEEVAKSIANSLIREYLMKVLQ